MNSRGTSFLEVLLCAGVWLLGLKALSIVRLDATTIANITKARIVRLDFFVRKPQFTIARYYYIVLAIEKKLILNIS